MPDSLDVTFELIAEATPCLLPRFSQILARRDVTPVDLRCRCIQGRMTIRAQCHTLDEMTRRTIEGNFRQLVGLHRVETILHRQRRAA